MFGSPRYGRLRDGVRDDVSRAIAMAAGGALAFGPIEYALTVWFYAGPLDENSLVRLIALTATLSLILWLGLTLGIAGIAIAWRLARARIDPAWGVGRGLFVAAPLEDDVRPGVPRIWAAIIALGAVLAVTQRIAAYALVHYKDGGLQSFWIASRSMIPVALAYPIYRLFRLAATAGGRAIAPIAGAFNPLGRWRACGVAVAGLVGVGMVGVWYLVPDARSYLSVRTTISAVVIGLGCGFGAHVHALRRPKLLDKRQAGFAAAGVLVLVTGTLAWWGGDVATRYMAITASPSLAKLIDVVRVMNDFDGDGFGSLLGDNDCAPFDSSINPAAEDKPDDGIDQDCDGEDFTLRASVQATGPSLPVPDKFKKDWNILFITVDTLRYDHTTFGGYKDAPKHRDTTPRLAELVEKSTSFAFTNAPSAGTMASIPAIITSKYFHSGIALDENMPPGTPPKLMPENVLLSEIMKRKGYYTGVIASHEYWNDWGMDQGVDDYDNSIGKTPDPYRVAADKSTDHALAWISRQQGKKWFLWVHYIDPHGRYVAHPDVIDYGATEPDLYDAEIRWTDQQLGRLFDELKRLPSHANTIIVLTSDHGDSMAEHNVPLGTHGTALYFELQHVPMIFYVPDNQPRLIKGAVSNLDIVPTVAELCGIDVHDLSFEGRSLVGSIFYGKEDRERIVFAETNAPGKQRAAISEKWKLIYYISNNIYELFDLTADPTEKKNLALENPKPAAFETMRKALSAWMERVLYARDPVFNQAFRQMSDVTLTEPPKPEVVTQGQTLDNGKIEIVGIGLDPGKRVVAGTRVDFHVYFHVVQRTEVPIKFLLSVWPVAATAPPNDPAPPTIIRTDMRPTGGGLFAADKWRDGEYVRERFSLDIPADWKGDAVRLGLVSGDANGQKFPATAAMPSNDLFTANLGNLPLVPKTAP